MASEEWAKRFLRLAGYSPKDTRGASWPRAYGEDEGCAWSLFRSQGHLHRPHDPVGLRAFRGQAPVDGSVGERDLRLAASC